MQTATPSREPEGVAQWEENLSAWLDGESTLDWPENIDTAAGRQTWDAYHLIGDVLRAGDLGAEPSPAFRRRLAEALDKELPIVAPRRRHVVKVGLSGLAVAAAVASVVWMARPYFGAGVAPSAGPGVLAEAEAPVQLAAEMPGLGDYLEAHRQVAGPSAVRQVSFDTGMGR
jgi:Negative regulator of sigma E activity